MELIIRIGITWYRKRYDSEIYGPIFFIMAFAIVYPTARMAGALHQLSRPNGFIKVHCIKWNPYVTMIAFLRLIAITVLNPYSTNQKGS